MLGVIAGQSPHSNRTTLDTSASRLHDRAENLQAASGKIGGHLFEAHIRIIASAPEEASRLATERLHQMAGAFGAFTQSRLATFHLGAIRRGDHYRPSGRGTLLSHEEALRFMGAHDLRTCSATRSLSPSSE